MSKLEVIAWSVEDAIRIEEAGADRIELVVELEKGGLTPSLDLVSKVLKSVKIPVMVMVRNVSESFIYSDEVMEQHIKYIEELKLLKPEGIVFGSLTKEGRINFDQLNQVIEAKGDLKLTFHRAFDELNSLIAMKEFHTLSRYNVDFLLTSGLKENALKGLSFIKKLVDQKTISILAGKGVDMNNYKEINSLSGADFLHVGYSVRDKENKIDINLIKVLKKGIKND